jgi:hypothetical protein
VNFYTTEFIGTGNVLNIQDDGKLDLAKAACDLLAIAEGTVKFQKVTNSYALYTDNLKTKFTAIYFVEELSDMENFAKEIQGLNGQGTIFVFSWDSYVNIEALGNIDNATIKPIPEPILQAYKRIFDTEVLS